VWNFWGIMNSFQRQCLALLLALVALSSSSFGGNASPNVPLDSWVYAAIDRLTTLGVVESPFLGARPWTRRECAIVVRDASAKFDNDKSGDDSVRALVDALNREFSADIETIDDWSSRTEVESLYTRGLYISGTPLRDSFHFGQTIANDYGRPFESGTQAIAGASAYAVRGRYFLYARGEYQHSSAFAGLPASVTSRLATIDGIAVPPNTSAHGTISEARLLDTYVGVKMAKWQATFGKQSLWWGTGNSGPLLFSNNVEPPYMFRLTNVDPIRLPSFLRWLGETRVDAFVGKLSGHVSPAHPYIHGEKISLKPTKDLELGFSRATVFLGDGRGATLDRILRSYFSVVSTNENVVALKDPGDRKGGFSVSYHVPKTQLSVYMDSFADDDPSPLSPSGGIPFGAFRRSPLNPGFYLARLPFTKKLDLRAEGFYTNVNAPRSSDGRFVYWNNTYQDSYTQNGFMLGNTIGREGQGAQVWSTYWFTPRNTLQFSYRGAKVAPDFIPGGGSQSTFYARTNLLMFRKLELTAQFHAERWNFPILANTPQKDFGGLLMLRLWSSDQKF
jgi:hypothetical protein